MMTHLLLISACILAAADAGPALFLQPASEVAASLTSIRELRVIDLAAAEDPGDDDEFFFTMSGESPSLALEWRIELPAGSKLISVENLRDLQATDSTGRDLAPDDLDDALSAMPRYEFGEFGEEPEEILDTITLTLALPDRKAEAFSITAQADATTSTGTADVKVAISDQWQTLAAEQFGDLPVRARLNREMGEVIGIEFSPASAAERSIAALTLNFEGEQLGDSGSMNDFTTITYFFEGTLDEGQAADLTITVRTGVETSAIRFEVKNQKLP